MGLGTAATTMPMVGCGDGGVELAQGTPSSAFLICPSPGKGECNFCSCCFLWIFLWSCCLASTDGEDRVVTWGWKEWASAAAAAAGTNAETDCGVFISKERKQGDWNTYHDTVFVCVTRIGIANKVESLKYLKFCCPDWSKQAGIKALTGNWH